MATNFAHRCGICGHEYTYLRNDLTYRDETMPSRAEERKCGAGESAEPPDRAFGAAK